MACPIVDLEIRLKSEFPNWHTKARHKILKSDTDSQGAPDSDENENEKSNETAETETSDENGESEKSEIDESDEESNNRRRL